MKILIIADDEEAITRREKWKFVKSVVKSIEKQKKQKSQTLSARGPLMDRTSHHLNSTS